MYKVGDEVLVKAEVTNLHEGLERPYFLCSYHLGWVSEDEIASKTYEQGLVDAWELARKIYDTTHADRNKIFGMDNSCNGIKNVFEMLSPQEALAKFEVYEKEKSVCVGDVVEDEEGTKALVIDEATENTCFVFTENGCVEDWYKMDLKKTGNKISIESLLRQIGE